MAKSYSSDSVAGYAAEKITPSDGVFPSGVSRGLWIGSAGTINVTFQDGTEADDMPAQVGWFPFHVSKVRPGGTSDDIWTIK